MSGHYSILNCRTAKEPFFLMALLEIEDLAVAFGPQAIAAAVVIAILEF